MTTDGDRADEARVGPPASAPRDAVVPLHELEDVRRLLRARGADLTAEAPIPPHVAARVHAALAAAPAHGSSSWGSSRRGALGAVAAAAALVVGVGAGVTLWPASDTPSVSVAAPRAEVIRAEVSTLIGRRDDGPFATASALAACLAANGVAADTPVLGSGPVTLDGREATLVVLPGRTPGALVALAVGPRCGPGIPDTVSRADIG